MTSSSASRGEVWFIDLSGPPRGHEPTKSRPALVVSVDKFNQGPAGLVILIPISRVAKGIPTHVEINPPEAGVKMRCFIKCEDVRSVSSDRLIDRWGKVSERTLELVEDRLKILLGLQP